MCKKRPKKPRINRPVFKVYPIRGRWKWWLEASNGKIYATSGGSYATKRACLKAIEAIKNLASRCEIEVEK
jgi:uncharacterized protein YegP (UPF0339 family)